MSAIFDGRVKHGMSKTRAYRCWRSMINRCTNKSDVNYHRYGGRGIAVCERWLTFANFYADMGDDNGLSIDREDNDGGYDQDNCKWSTPKEQANNTRNNRYLTIDGETKTVSQWSDVSPIPYGTIVARLQKGWTDKESVFRKLKFKVHKFNSECDKVIRYLYSKGYTQARLASAYGVTRTRIRHILEVQH